MADVAIVSRATVAAPKDYTLAAGEELALKAVRASVDGSGAGGSFLPALQLVAPDGTVMWTACDPANVFAAGASADVTWFPGVTANPFAPNTGGQWVSYTPTWTEKAGVQPSLGNGTLTGLYFQLGKMVVCRIVLTAGTTTTFGNAGSIWYFSLPVPAAAAFISFGMASNSHDPAAGDIITWGYADTTTQMAGWGYGPGTAAKLVQFLNSAQPTAWGAGAVVRLAGTYEAA